MTKPAAPLDGDADGVLDPLGPPLRRPDPPILGPVPSARGDGDPAPAADDDEGGRYRRTARPAPVPGEARMADPFAPTAESALAVPGVGAGRSVAEPLAALAAAFQANAEALRRSQEMQNELGRALQRADRSEVMVQTTGALNETFKGLTNVQRSLVSRIDASERSAKEGRWFLPILVLAAMAVLGAALWLVVRKIGELERDVVGNGDIATQLAAAHARGVEDGKAQGEAGLAAERAALAARADRAEADLEAARKARDEAAAGMKRAEAELAAAQAEVVGGRAAELRARALEAEVTRLRAEGAVRDPEVERLKRELSAEKDTSSGLRRRLAEVSTGRTPAAEAPPPAESAVPTPEAPPADRRDLDRVRRVLNEVLAATASPTGEYLQFGKIGGASPERLSEVLVTSYGAGGRVLNFVRAKTARVYVDRTARRAEIVFDEGALEMGGQSVPFPEGTFRRIVAEGDAISRWLQSGLLFVQVR